MRASLTAFLHRGLSPHQFTTMNNSNLKRMFGLSASFVVLVGCDLSDAPQMRAKMDCVNHLKELGLSVATEANDHAGTIPGDFLFLTKHTISPSVTRSKTLTGPMPSFLAG